MHDPPPPRVDHTATIMPSGHILIIGGVVYTRNVTDPRGMQTLNPVSMNSILLFDTAAGQWSNITAGGNIPAPRRGHSAVLSKCLSIYTYTFIPPFYILVCLFTSKVGINHASLFLVDVLQVSHKASC